MDKIALWLCFIIGAFFLGGIMFSYIIPLEFANINICALSGDGNPGASNVFKLCGPLLGTVCLALDMLKGFLPVFAATHLLDYKNLLFSLVIAAPVIGHAVAPLCKCSGGKCIATSFGVFLGALPASGIVFLLAGLFLLFSTAIKINPHRLRSLVTFSFLFLGSVIMLFVTNNFAPYIGGMIVSVTGFVKHLPDGFSTRKAIDELQWAVFNNRK